MSTLLKVIQDVAYDVGISVPTAVMSSSELNIKQLLSFANQVATELAARVDWGAMVNKITINGTGILTPHPISGMYKLIDGAAVYNSLGDVVRPLTAGEFPNQSVEGIPRYFLKQGQTIKFWPFMAIGDTCVAYYVTDEWLLGGGNEFADDSDGTKFPIELLTLGLITHWRRQKGMPYQDQEAAFESRLSELARNDDKRRFE